MNQEFEVSTQEKEGSEMVNEKPECAVIQGVCRTRVATRLIWPVCRHLEMR